MGNLMTELWGSLVIWVHTVLLASATRPIQMNTPTPLTPASKSGTRFTYPGGMEG